MMLLRFGLKSRTALLRSPVVLQAARYKSDGAPKSPLKAFMESIREQVAENREFQQNVKLLQDDASKLSESEAVVKAREAYAKTKTDVAQSEALRKGVEGAKKTAEVVGKTARKVAKDVSDTELAKASARTLKRTGKHVGVAAQAIGEGVEKGTAPIRKTRAYSEVKDQIGQYVEDSGARYGGYVAKEVRRDARKAKGKSRAARVAENPDAGAHVVLHKDSAWKESWSKFKENNGMVQGLFSMKKSYEESEHPMLERVRDVTDRIGETFASIFDESEEAKTVRKFRETVDPNFQIEEFMREARTYIVPELLDAMLAGDQAALRQWCSEATFNVLTAGIKIQLQQGLISDSRVVDIRQVELVSAKILDNDIPVVIISFATQEIVVFRRKKTGEIVAGKEDEVLAVRYVAVLTKTEEDLANPLTGGWRIMDMAKHDSRPTW